MFKLIKQRTRVRQKLCTSLLSGKAYLQELLDGSPTQMFDLFRMRTNAFLELRDHFRERGWLTDSRHIDVEEKMAFF